MAKRALLLGMLAATVLAAGCMILRTSGMSSWVIFLILLYSSVYTMVPDPIEENISLRIAPSLLPSRT